MREDDFRLSASDCGHNIACSRFPSGAGRRIPNADSLSEKSASPKSRRQGQSLINDLPVSVHGSASPVIGGSGATKQGKHSANAGYFNIVALHSFAEKMYVLRPAEFAIRQS